MEYVLTLLRPMDPLVEVFPNQSVVEYVLTLCPPQVPLVEVFPNQSVVEYKLQLAAKAASWFTTSIPTFANAMINIPVRIFFSVFIFFSFFSLFIMKFIIIISSNITMSTIYYIFYNIYLFCYLSIGRFKETSKGGEQYHR